MTRVTLDTNEYVSAFHFRGRPFQLLYMAASGEIEIALSKPILNETLRVLRDKFRWSPYDINDLSQRLVKTCRMVEPDQRVSVLGDEPDNRILECAQAAGSDYIITEDRPMLRLKEFAGAKIVSVAEFLSRERQR